MAGAGHLERMLEPFEAFFSSNAAMVGEEGAEGFGAWAATNGRKLPEGMPGQIVTEPEEEEEEESGGWSGWQELELDVPAPEPAETDDGKPSNQVSMTTISIISHPACSLLHGDRTMPLQRES